MATSSWGWHGMASFAERGLTPHPAKKKSKYLKGSESRVYPTYCLFPCLVQSSVATNTSIHSTQDPFSSQSQKGFQQLVLHV